MPCCLARPADEHLDAKIGAFPFTTIDSNVAQAKYSAPDPSCVGNLKTASQNSNTGWPANVLGKPRGHRYHSITLKDVAGLVPGAYQGRGRGNAFLNELCDADVLIHIVDAAGLCDENGNGLEAALAAKSEGLLEESVGDPLRDIS